MLQLLILQLPLCHCRSLGRLLFEAVLYLVFERERDLFSHHEFCSCTLCHRCNCTVVVSRYSPFSSCTMSITCTTCGIACSYLFAYVCIEECMAAAYPCKVSSGCLDCPGTPPPPPLHPTTNIASLHMVPCVAGENWVAANKVGCDAHVDPRLGSPIMQAPSFTGDGAGRFSELGATIEGSGPHSNSNGTPAVRTSQSSKQSDANRYVAVSSSRTPCFYSLTHKRGHAPI